MRDATPPTSPASAGPCAEEAGASATNATLLDTLPPVELEALRWSVRMSDGLDAAAREAFEKWLDAAPAHRAAYEELTGVWDAIAQVPPAGAAQLRATLAIDIAAESAARGTPPQRASAAESAGTGTTPHHTLSPRLTRRRTGQAFAAVAAAAVLTVGGWLGWSHQQSQPVFNRSYATERGRSLEVTLPDGSRLQLDTATQADVTLYRNRREVRLPEGQVFFRVQSDAAKPFDVLAGSARVTVVGTQFSVRFTPSLGSQAVQVSVTEGQVRVTPQGQAAESGQSVMLTAGQTVAADGQGKLGAIAQGVADSIAPWRHKRLSFDNTPLSQVLAEIGRYGDFGVRTPDPAVGSLPVTASVDLRNVDLFVRALPQVLPVRLERKANALEIVKDRR